MEDRGSGYFLQIRKNIGFLSNTRPEKNHKATKPAFNVERYLNDVSLPDR